MRNCDYYQKMFSALIDEDLQDDKTALVRQHLVECGGCQARLNELVLLKQSLAGLQRPTTSASFDVLLHARIRQETRARQKRRRSFAMPDFGWRIPAYAAAALFFLFLGALLQRLAIYQGLTPARANLASMEFILQDQNRSIEPGYMILAGVDSVNNKFRIVNYVDLDGIRMMQDLEQGPDSPTEQASAEMLPNLASAPENVSVLSQQTLLPKTAKIQQAEFIF